MWTYPVSLERVDKLPASSLGSMAEASTCTKSTHSKPRFLRFESRHVLRSRRLIHYSVTGTRLGLVRLLSTLMKWSMPHFEQQKDPELIVFVSGGTHSHVSWAFSSDGLVAASLRMCSRSLVSWQAQVCFLGINWKLGYLQPGQHDLQV